MGNMGQKWRRRYWRCNKLAPRWQGLWFLFGCFVGRGNRWATQTNARLIHPGNGYGSWLFHSKQTLTSPLSFCRLWFKRVSSNVFWDSSDCQTESDIEDVMTNEVSTVKMIMNHDPNKAPQSKFVYNLLIDFYNLSWFSIFHIFALKK